LNVLGICGSLRAASLNRAVLKLAGEVMPEGMHLESADIRPVPFFDGDLLAQGFPAPVAELRERIRAADGVLIATPEYNFSVPGVLKNALDWVSRGEDQPFALKPVCIVTASPGQLGGARVQYELRRVLLFMNAQVMAKPEVFIGGAAAKFQEGVCVDDATRQFVRGQMLALEKWVGMVKRMAGS
jgi:chromate reductase